MEIKIEWKEGKYPSFNVMVCSAPGRDPFITIRGCSIKSGAKGEFIGYPARKQDDGKYFNYIYASDAFNKLVIEKAKEALPKPTSRGGDFDDLENDVPF